MRNDEMLYGDLIHRWRKWSFNLKIGRQKTKVFEWKVAMPGISPGKLQDIKLVSLELLAFWKSVHDVVFSSQLFQQKRSFVAFAIRWKCMIPSKSIFFSSKVSFGMCPFCNKDCVKNVFAVATWQKGTENRCIKPLHLEQQAHFECKFCALWEESFISNLKKGSNFPFH